MVDKVIGIDLGTTNIRIYKRKKGIILKEPSVVAPVTPSIWEAGAGRSLWVQGQPGLHSEFQDRQDT